MGTSLMHTELTEPVSIDGRTMVRKRVHVRMRDGVLLATDLYARDEFSFDGVTAHRIMLERTPYGIRAERFSDGVHDDGAVVTPESGALFFVEHGYIVVRQDCRGRGDSEGRFSKYVGEALDGFDTLAWLTAQPWCDGRVVTAGVSYSAHVQTAAASVGSPGSSR